MTANFKKNPIKTSFRLFILLVLSSSSYAELNSAIPGKHYSHKTGKFQIMLSTAKKVPIYSKYNWIICNEALFNEKKLNTGGLPNLNKYIETWFKGTARHIAAFLENSEDVFTESTNKKLMTQLSSSLNPMGICVDNLKIYPYNK